MTKLFEQMTFVRSEPSAFATLVEEMQHELEAKEALRVWEDA
jgi:hypothetical protein